MSYIMWFFGVTKSIINQNNVITFLSWIFLQKNWLFRFFCEYSSDDSIKPGNNINLKRIGKLMFVQRVNIWTVTKNDPDRINRIESKGLDRGYMGDIFIFLCLWFIYRQTITIYNINTKNKIVFLCEIFNKSSKWIWCNYTLICFWLNKNDNFHK